MTERDNDIARAMAWFGEQLEEKLRNAAARSIMACHPCTVEEYTMHNILNEVANTVSDTVDELRKAMPDA